jgi:protein-tyrosine-phosphatase
MAEWGIDIPAERPKKLTDDVAQNADVIVTMGCGDACPVYAGNRYLDRETPTRRSNPSMRFDRSETTSTPGTAR